MNFRRVLLLILALTMSLLLCSCRSNDKEIENVSARVSQSDTYATEATEEEFAVEESYSPAKTDSGNSGESEEPGKEEQLYQTAIEAENNYFYTYARYLFQSIGDYKDAAAHYEYLTQLLSEYEGTYTVNLFGGGTYQMEVKDGIAKLYFNDADDPSTEYFQFAGWDFNGEAAELEIILTYDSQLSQQFSSDNDSDCEYVPSEPNPALDDNKYSIMSNDDGDFVMIIAIEGNAYTYWDGYIG